ncbi:Uma2 family endonuclease [Rhizobium leguminosarum]|uniref:Uma2 family endonuclease n=1 Tax=Rhizobium leguminosarum TaxID=384 RepID=UPI003F9EA2C8
MTVDEFLTWEAEQPDRYEFLDGQPVPLEPSTQARSSLIVDIVSLLKPALRDTGMRVLINIRVPLPLIQECRYPAIVVDSGPYASTATEPTQPVAVIDVDRHRDWSTLSEVRYLSLYSGDDPETVLTFLQWRTN